jgi:hypothetical protein
MARIAAFHGMALNAHGGKTARRPDETARLGKARIPANCRVS